MKMNADKAIMGFIKLRDKIKALEKAHKEEVRPLKEMQEKLQQYLIQKLDADGATNIKSSHGTAFKARKDAVSIQNKSDFMIFLTNEILEHGVDGLGLLTLSANKNAVKEFMADHDNDLPPGIKYDQWQEIQVRVNND